MLEKRVLTSSEAMTYLGYKKNKFFDLLKEQKIKPLPGYGKNHRFDIKDLDEYLENLKKEGTV